MINFFDDDIDDDVIILFLLCCCFQGLKKGIVCHINNYFVFSSRKPAVTNNYRNASIFLNAEMRILMSSKYDWLGYMIGISR